MMDRKLKATIALLVLALTLFGLFSPSMVRASEVQSPLNQEAGVNLLVNPGLEGIGRPSDSSTPNHGNWTRDTYTGAQYGEIFTPEGWVTWWSESDDFKRPECKVIPNEPPFNGTPSRIHQGYYSGLCFTFFGKQNAGYYQVVRNIPAGSVVEGSFYAHAWSCGQDDPPLSCGDEHGFYFRVGIDPNGGTDPFSGNIVWSSPYYHYDNFGMVGPVQATVGASGAATLFVQAYGKWPLKHNDAYMDSASLKMVTPATPATETPPPPPPTSETPSTEEASSEPAATPTRRPDGSIVHTVAAGDTLFGIAIEYGVDVDQIYQLNGLDSSSLLMIGQEIVVSTTGGSAAPAPTATPTTSEPAETETTPEVVSPTATPANEMGSGPVAPPPAGKASVCVVAFHDANEDMFRQDDGSEMLLPNAELNLLAQSGPVDSYTTDGISEPWCFESLDPGTYILRHSPPAGYVLTDGGQWNLNLSDGEVENVEIAYKRDPDAGEPGAISDPGETEGPTEEPTEDEEGRSGVTNVLNVVLRVSGFIVLALAIAVLVLFVLSRRSAS